MSPGGHSWGYYPGTLACSQATSMIGHLYIDGLVQKLKRRHSSALAMELRSSCTKPSIWYLHY